VLVFERLRDFNFALDAMLARLLGDLRLELARAPQHLVQILRDAQTFVRRIAFEPFELVEDGERPFALVARVAALGSVRDGLEFPTQRRHAQFARSTIAAGIAFEGAPFEHAIAARRDLRLPQELQKLDRFDLLILDDISYVRRDQAETSVLFELVAERYERKSIAITANTPFSQWNEVFVDAAMTLAAIDRLVHHATILEMNVESYRRRDAEANVASQRGNRKSPATQPRQAQGLPPPPRSTGA